MMWSLIHTDSDYWMKGSDAVAVVQQLSQISHSLLVPRCVMWRTDAAQCWTPQHILFAQLSTESLLAWIHIRLNFLFTCIWSSSYGSQRPVQSSSWTLLCSCKIPHKSLFSFHAPDMRLETLLHHCRCPNILIRSVSSWPICCSWLKN